MEKQVVLIDIADIANHPLNADIYGEPELDRMLADDIKEHGILEPLHVFENFGFYPDIEQKYVLISGHRRKFNGALAGLSQVPCIIEYYPNTEEIEIVLVLFNLQRTKKLSAIEHEKNVLEQKLCQFSKYRQKYGLTFDPANLDDEVCRLLQILNIDTSKAFNSTEILAKHFGLSRPTMSQLEFIFSDELLEFFFNELTTVGAKNSEITALSLEFEDTRRAVDSEAISINAAHNHLVEKVNELAKTHNHELKGKKLLPLAKPVKEKTERKPKSTKKEKKGVEDITINVHQINSDGPVLLSSMSFSSSSVPEISINQNGEFAGSLDFSQFLNFFKEACYDHEN